LVLIGKGSFLQSQFIVTLDNLLDFGVEVGALFPALTQQGEAFKGLGQGGSLVVLGSAFGHDPQKTMFAGLDITGHLLTKAIRVTVDIQPIILNLKSQAHQVPHSKQGAGLCRLGTSDQSPYFEGRPQKHGRFEANHFAVLFHSNRRSLLEIHIHLLTLANLQSHPVKFSKNFREDAQRSLG